MLEDQIRLEQSICAAILSVLSEGPEGTAMMSNLAARLDPSDFRSDECRAIYVASRAIHMEGKKPDELLVHRKDDRLGIGMLSKLADQCATIANVVHHADTLIDLSKRRKLQTMADRFVAAARKEEPNALVQKLVKEALDFLNDDIQGSPFGKSLLTYEHVAEQMVRQKYEPNEAKIFTGFTVLDRFLGGLFPERMYLIAARPSMGKSALAGTMAFNVAKAGGNVALFSNEMPAADVMTRLLAAEANVDIGYWMNTEGTQDEERRLLSTARRLTRDNRLHIFDGLRMDLGAIKSACLHCKATVGLDAVFIDYIQMMPVNLKLPREQAMGELSRELKQLAREMSVPVIACSQLNRSAEARQDKRPMLSDLRDTGQLEQDADVAMLLYRDAYYNQDKENNKLEVNIAKNRHGQTGTVYLSWDPNRTKVAD